MRDAEDDPTARSAAADDDDDRTVESGPAEAGSVGPGADDAGDSAAVGLEADEDGDTIASPRFVSSEPTPSSDPPIDAAEADDTVALELGDTAGVARPDDDPTALLAAGRPESAAAAPSRMKPAIAPARRRRRPMLKPAPVPPGYGGRAIIAPGVGAVSTYGVRAIPRPPASAQAFAHRSVSRVSADLPSAARRSRRLSLLALGGFGIAVVVSATGLVLIVRSAVLGY